MSFQATFPRVAVLAVLAGFLSSCAGEGGSSDSGSSDDPAVLKLSYFRALPEPRTKKLEPNFRVVMSESWRDRMGESPREPLAKAAPGRIYMGFISDLQMNRHMKKLRELGIDDLIARNPDELKPEEFARACVDPQKTGFIRVLTVGNEKGSKSYYYPDQQGSPNYKALIEKFLKCEMFILRACEYAIQVRTMSDPMPGRDPRQK